MPARHECIASEIALLSSRYVKVRISSIPIRRKFEDLSPASMCRRFYCVGLCAISSQVSLSLLHSMLVVQSLGDELEVDGGAIAGAAAGGMSFSAWRQSMTHLSHSRLLNRKDGIGVVGRLGLSCALSYSGVDLIVDTASLRFCKRRRPQSSISSTCKRRRPRSFISPTSSTSSSSIPATVDGNGNNWDRNRTRTMWCSDYGRYRNCDDKPINLILIMMMMVVVEPWLPRAERVREREIYIYI